MMRRGITVGILCIFAAGFFVPAAGAQDAGGAAAGAPGVAGSAAPADSAAPAASAAAVGSIGPEALLALLLKGSASVFLVDVRTKGEYDGGHIPTALNRPVDTIGKDPPTPDKAALIVVYCGSGMRSARAAALLATLGYVDVIDFGAVGRWPWPLVATDPAVDCPCREIGALSSISP